MLLGWWLEKGVGTQSFAGYDQPNTQFKMQNQVSLWSLLPPSSLVTSSSLLPLLGITVATPTTVFAMALLTETPTYTFIYLYEILNCIVVGLGSTWATMHMHGLEGSLQELVLLPV